MTSTTEMSKLLCRCYKWLGERKGYSAELVDFLIKWRGSVDTIEKESRVERCFLTCDDRETVGVVSVIDNQITKLYVDPARHRMRYGRLLFEKVEQVIKEKGYTKIVLTALGDSSVPFYVSMGMTAIDCQYRELAVDENIEGLLFEKALG